MLSNRLYKYVSILFPTFVLLGISNHAWETKRQIFIPSAKYVGRATYNFSFHSIFTIINFSQVIQYYLAHNLNKVMLLKIFLIAKIGAWMSFVVTVYSAEEFFFACNSMLVYLRRINGQTTKSISTWFEFN